MAAKKSKDIIEPKEPKVGKTVDLAALLSEASEKTLDDFSIWLVGTTPLIVHAWSHKAKHEMLHKQSKKTKTGKEARDPDEDFRNSLYEMGTEDKKKIYGFPVTGIKNAILSSAHKDKGVPRSVVQSALYLDADMVRVRPAMAGAVCDMPLVRIYSGDPEMREDMVRIGAGLNKTANLAYRAQFSTWAIKVIGQFNSTVLTAEALGFLIKEAGVGIGIGEWRNEKKGIFGGFHVATASEQQAWEKFAAGKGPLPVKRQTVMLAEAAE